MFLLARTAPGGKPQAGISFLLTPMDTPGLTVRPILSMSGEHEVNQVFFDDVRIPVENRVGEEHQGWTVAKALLVFERGGGVAASRLAHLVEEARSIARREDASGDNYWNTNPEFRQRLVAVEAEVRALDYKEREVAAQLSAGLDIGGAAQVLKLTVSRLGQLATELAVEALGGDALADPRAILGPGDNEAHLWADFAQTMTAKYLNHRAATIFGGSQEVQHNIVARAVLGL
jgi:alkylation response protein AidB-like acyl-CoA dehydrogenase